MYLSRRDFIRNATASAVAAGVFPSIAANSQRVSLAFIGIGNRGRDDFMMFANYPELVKVAALCDTQMGAAHTMPVLKACPDAPRYTDFRKMLEERANEIDAVVIATPDFSHFPAAMMAMSLGKAVFCEKPLGNNFREIAILTAAAKRHGVVTQMGNQGHSGPNYWQFRELTANGFIKDVTRIEAYMCAERRWHKWNGKLQEMPSGGTKPEELDWDLWQSQRPERQFSNDFINGEWRSFYDYGTGALGDWGAHIFDTAWEFLKLGMPSKIETTRDDGATKAVYPLSSTITFTFPRRGENLPECRLTWRDGIGNYPEMPAKLTDARYSRGLYGSEMYAANGLVFARATHGNAMRLIAGADPKDPAMKRTMRSFPHDKSEHYLNFLKAVKGEERPTSPFEVAGPLSQVMALGALAQRRNAKTLIFNRETMRFANDAIANSYLDGLPPRKGWEQFYKL